MVREAKPLTSVVPVGSTQTRKPTMVLEVSDPEAIANLGEQLTLANELVIPAEAETAAKPAKTTARKRSSKSTAAKSTTTRKTSARKTAAKSTTTKAKQKNTVEATLTVPVPPSTEQQMLEQVQQLTATVAELQNRINHLNHPNDNPSIPDPILANPHATSTKQPSLPNWDEPELRSHYTLQESARAYEALEALHAHRTLKSPASQEVNDAYAVADQLRHPPSESVESSSTETVASRTAIDLPNPRRRSRRSRRYNQGNNAPMPAIRPTSEEPHHSSLPSVRHRPSRKRRRYHWDAQRCWNNLQQLGQSLIPVPHETGAKIVDITGWVLVSIAVRLVIKQLVHLIPMLGMPMALLMAVPAIVAAYLAFCVHNSRADVIYRLLLVTLGLFLGGRL